MDDELDRFAPRVLLNNRSQLARELGRGGMGAVYAASDTVLGAPVAIKVLLFDRPGPKLVGRFMQEARAAAQVRHTNIVSVLDIGQDVATGALFLVQEFLHGQDLKRRILSGGPLSPREAIETLYPIMRALDFAHTKGIVHRDLKPDNIFLCETHDGIVPKVIDFGIAKVTDGHGQSAQNTATSQVLGTPYYMAPEQARGDRAVDHRADIWSLGVVLFYALTRRYPYEGTTTNLIISNIITRQPTPITAFAPTLPLPVVELVQRALQYESEQRYPSMDSFAQAARACLSSLGVSVTAPLRSAPPTATIALSQPPQPPEVFTDAPQVVVTERVESSPQTRARPFALFAAVLALGSGLGLAIYFAKRHDGPTQPASPPTEIAAMTTQTSQPVARPAAQPSAPPSAASAVAPVPIVMVPAVVATPRPTANAATPPTQTRPLITQPAQSPTTRIGARARPRPQPERSPPATALPARAPRPVAAPASASVPQPAAQLGIY